MKEIIEANEFVYPNSDLLNSLKASFPQFFNAEGDFKADKFAEELQSNNVQEARDGYRLSFVGKDYARLQTGRASETMIMPDAEHNSKPENADSQNVFITGDNLEALRHLQNAYLGKVKMIYIDPPYNTGKEFVYNDRFEFDDEKLKSALGYSNDEIARLKTIQGKSSHSAWLTFMYPRLKLAQKLLSNDGVIFVSIDDNEQANLKLLMDDVFGEGNFVGEYIWRKKEGGGQAKEYFVIEHEYIYVYRKTNSLIWTDKRIIRDIAEFNKEDELGKFKATKLAKWGNTARREDRPSMYFPLIAPDQTDVYPIAPDGNEGRWRVGKERMNEIITQKLLHWKKRDNNWVAYEKDYYDNQIQIIKQRSILYDLANTGDGSNILTEIFGRKDVFENPKPIELLKELLFCGTSEDSIILDFFAGSATTAHAVMQLNAEDGGNRKYIMVQLDEQTNPDSEALKAGYHTIDEISRERIKRAAAKIKSNNPMFAENLDLGFKHYRLTTPTAESLDKITEFNPTENRLFEDDMVSALGGLDAILATWLIDDGYDFSQPAQIIDFAGYTAHYIDNSVLYLISQDWGAEQTKTLLNKIGKHELNINTIIVFGYSFTMESLRELEMNVKNTLDKQVLIEKRY